MKNDHQEDTVEHLLNTGDNNDGKSPTQLVGGAELFLELRQDVDNLLQQFEPEVQRVSVAVINQQKLVKGLSEKDQNMDTEVDNRISQLWETLLDLQKEVRLTVALLDDVNTRLEKIELKPGSSKRAQEHEPSAEIPSPKVTIEPHLTDKIAEAVGRVFGHPKVKVENPHTMTIGNKSHPKK